MQIGVIGLGRMGGNISKRLMRAGHECVVYDRQAETVKELAAAGAKGSDDLASLVSQLAKPRAVWVMLPAGEITGQTIDALAALMDAGDIIIDGGNSFFKDDISRAQTLKAKGLFHVDVGTSGGIWGLDRGYCLMIGGDKAIVDHLDPIFKTLAPGIGEIPLTPRTRE